METIGRLGLGKENGNCYSNWGIHWGLHRYNGKGNYCVALRVYSVGFRVSV